MNLNDISTQLLFTTVPILIQKKNSVETGTGFIFNYQNSETPPQSIPLLITNFHVVKDGSEGVVEFIEKSEDKPLRDNRIKLKLDRSTLSTRLGDQSVDLFAIPIAPMFNQLAIVGKHIFYRSVGSEILPTREILDDLSAMEEITFIGYPSGIFDEHNSSPLIRRGITASPVWNDFKGEQVFLIDAGVFPGSSGSPVFLLNQGSYATRNGLTIGSRLHFLGVLSETFLRIEGPNAKSFLGLGKVINSIRFQSYVESVVADLKRQGRL